MPTLLFLILILALSILLPKLGSELMSYTKRTPARFLFGVILMLAGLLVCIKYYMMMLSFDTIWLDRIIVGSFITHVLVYSALLADSLKKNPEEEKYYWES